MRFEKTLRPCSLRIRLMVMFVGGMLVSAAVIAVAVTALAEPFGRHMLNASVRHYAKEMAERVLLDAHGRPLGLDAQRIEPWLFNSLAEEVTLRIVDAQGHVAFTSEAGGNSRALVPEGVAFDPSLKVFTFLRDGVAMHGATARVEHSGGRWWLQLGLSDRIVLRMRSAFGIPGLIQGVSLTGVAFVLLFFVTVHFTLRRALLPLRAASADACRITPKTLDARLDVDAQPREIRPLVLAFNQALDRLQHGYQTQQEFLASAAHELKTPLALMRAQVELGPHDERRQYLLQDVDRMARQVQQLLMLAEVSEPQNYRIERIDPRSAVQEVFDYMGRVAERHGVRLGLRMADDLRQWQADRSALFTLLKNLMENAIQHSPAGAVVALSVNQSGFVVRDEGPGVAPEHLSRLFERFWRGPDRREDGAGLGLSICMEIATAHRWRLVARNTGHGLEMVTELVPSDQDGDSVSCAPRPAGSVRVQSTSPSRAMLGALF
ncbi:Signal transduction histidine kinase [Roseateles sp. YR242]|uniref:sensor histidine kinase n=1 Tax=Roseateles sp. YR242 TaxID=1855305 RepID=UPI0008D416C8|nr:ATP-binding protein [Roseateles sp. YR242]SEK78892.1 Signal transduction histidine kinase [Roseateles sp. YR242]